MKLLNTWNLMSFPPSVNHMFVNRYGGKGRNRYLSKEYQQFKKEFAADMMRHVDVELKQYKNAHLSLQVDFFWRGWFTKAGELWVNRDVSNRYKAIEDSLFRHIGIDDSRNVMPIMTKQNPERHMPDKYMVAKLYLMDPYTKRYEYIYV